MHLNIYMAIVCAQVWIHACIHVYVLCAHMCGDQRLTLKVNSQ